MQVHAVVYHAFRHTEQSGSGWPECAGIISFCRLVAERRCDKLWAMTTEAALPHTHGHAHGQRPVRNQISATLPWLDVEVLSVAVTLVFLLLGGFGVMLGLPTAIVPWCFLAAYLAGGWHGTIHGLRTLLHGTVDVDLLMILAALGAAYVHHAFEGAMLLFLFSLSHALQEMAIEKSRSAISALMTLRPEVALRKQGTTTELVAIDDLVVGDLIIVRPGESIPVDGVVTEGEQQRQSGLHHRRVTPHRQEDRRCPFCRHDERARQPGDEGHEARPGIDPVQAH